MSYSDRMTAAHRTGEVFDFTRGDRFRRARLSEVSGVAEVVELHPIELDPAA